MKRLLIRVQVLIFFFLLIQNFHTEFLNAQSNSINPDITRERTPKFLKSDTVWVNSLINKMDLDEKIAQLLMVAAYSNRDESHAKELDELVKKYNVGGLIFFQGGPVRQAILTNRFQKMSKVPLLIAMDAEWGLDMRLDSTISYPHQMMLGALQDDNLIYKMGYDFGKQLKRLGVHINFAPVADVNNNPENPVINHRSFGENQNKVSVKAENYFIGLQDAGVIGTAKHFPGHGDTNSDSHFSLPIIKHNKARLDSIELFPFKYLINRGIPAIMTAHLNVIAFDSTKNLASSLSPLIIDSLLKKTFGFEGLVITDALNMKGVSEYFKHGEVELAAFIAGNDILLMPGDVPKVISEFKRDIRKGIITEEEIDQRCRKVLFAKAWAGLKNFTPVKTDSLLYDLNLPIYNVLKRKLITNAITVIQNNNQAIPIFKLEESKLATLTIGSGDTDIFSETLKLYTQTDAFYISKLAPSADFDSLQKKLLPYNTLIISIQETSTRPAIKYGITENTIKFINELNFKGSVIFTLFGNPYSLSYFESFKNIDAVIVAYDNEMETKEITAQLIFGAIPAKGILPVSAKPFFQSGQGIQIDQIQRLAYGIPEEENIDSKLLSNIDTIVLNAIRNKAIPGCQVLVARNNKVIFNKAFGYHTYRNNIKVGIDDLYDIASITKIASTIPSLMKLVDERKFDISKTLSFYLPELNFSNKENLRIDNILAHQAGLQAWVPFYYKTIECLDTSEAFLSTKLSDKYPNKLAPNAYANRNIKLKDNIFSKSYSNEYPINVAKDMYLRKDYRDTVYQSIIKSDLIEKMEYRYSDLGYYFMQMIIERITDMPIYPYVYENFYSKIGAATLGYLPLSRFPENRIIPTENDLLFRRQLLKGYVHDPGAAMLGGVAGHAGLFSSANDLAKMMQMYLNGGVYGGRILLSDTIIRKFTSRAFLENGNRRGLGFDKPEPDPKKISPASKSASPLSFGHSGFTGTLVWVDPQYNLIYIFLSNRIYPDQFNTKLVEMDIRTKIQDTIYGALK